MNGCRPSALGLPNLFVIFPPFEGVLCARKQFAFESSGRGPALGGMQLCQYSFALAIPCQDRRINFPDSIVSGGAKRGHRGQRYAAPGL
jgi:hypothetical protein